MSRAIRVKELVHLYNEGMPYETLALDKVSFEIFEGEFVAIIGHTGSGKSTLIQHLNGILKPKSGKIFIGELEISKKNTKLIEIRRNIGLVFQYPEYQLFEETVYKDIAFGPKNLGLDEDAVDHRIKEALSLVDLDFEKFAERSPFELSGGQKRRVAIAGVLAMEPKILMLDEPTAGLDPRSHKLILNMIEKIRVKKNMTVILVSHNMSDVGEMASKVLVMDRGQLVKIGEPREIFAEREYLEKIGLDLPPITDFMQDLKNKGLDIRADVLNIDEAEEELDKFLKERKKNI